MDRRCGRNQFTVNVRARDRADVILVGRLGVVLGGCGTARAVEPIYVIRDTGRGRFLQMQIVLQLFAEVVSELRDEDGCLVGDLLRALGVGEVFSAAACTLIVAFMTRLGAGGFRSLAQLECVNVLLLGSKLIGAIRTELRGKFGRRIAGGVGKELIVLRAALDRARVRVPAGFGVIERVSERVLADDRSVIEILCADLAAARAVIPINADALTVDSRFLEVVLVLELFGKVMAQSLAVEEGLEAPRTAFAAVVVGGCVQAVSSAHFVFILDNLLRVFADVRRYDLPDIDLNGFGISAGVRHGNGSRRGSLLLLGAGCCERAVLIDRDPVRAFNGPDVGLLTAAGCRAQIDLGDGLGLTSGNVKGSVIDKGKRSVTDDHRSDLGGELIRRYGVADEVRTDAQVILAVAIDRAPVERVLLAVLHRVVKPRDRTVACGVIRGIDLAEPLGGFGASGYDELLREAVTFFGSVQANDGKRLSDPLIGNSIVSGIRCETYELGIPLADPVLAALDESRKLLLVKLDLDGGCCFLYVYRHVLTQSQLLCLDGKQIAAGVVPCFDCDRALTRHRLADAVNGHLVISALNGSAHLREGGVGGGHGGDDFSRFTLIQCDFTLVQGQTGHGIVAGKCSVLKVEHDRAVVAFIRIRACTVGHADPDGTGGAGSLDAIAKLSVGEADRQALGKIPVYDLDIPIIDVLREVVRAPDTGPQVGSDIVANHTARQRDQSVTHPLELGRLIGIGKHRVRHGLTEQIPHLKRFVIVVRICVVPEVSVARGRGRDGMGREARGQRGGQDLALQINTAALLEGQGIDLGHRHTTGAAVVIVQIDDYGGGGVCQMQCLEARQSCVLVARKIYGKGYVIPINDRDRTVIDTVQLGKPGGGGVVQLDAEAYGVGEVGYEFKVSVHAIALGVGREGGGYVNFHRAALDVQYRADRFEARGQGIRYDVQNTVLLTGQGDIGHAAARLKTDGAPVRQRNGVLSDQMKVQHLFGRNGAAVVAAERQRTAGRIVAPAFAGSVTLHFHGGIVSDGEKSVLIRACTVGYGDGYGAIVTRVIRGPVFVGDFDRNAPRIARGCQRAADDARKVYVEAGGKLALNHLKAPIIRICMVCGSSAHACFQVDRDRIVHLD